MLVYKYLSRKLISLGYPDIDNFDVTDDGKYRFVVSWLENRFICQYDPEDRKNLNDITSDQWTNHYDKYLVDLNIPITSADRNASLDWLLGLAVQNHYKDNNANMQFSALTGEQYRKNQQTNLLVTSLDNIDMNTPEFKAGVYQLATLIGVAHHPDHLRVLRACSRVIVDKMSQTHIDQAKTEQGKIKMDFVDIDEVAHSINTGGDAELQRITTVLRLIHIHKLRQLQMDINSVTVAVQEFVADPKTNEKLGKVGY